MTGREPLVAARGLHARWPGARRDALRGVDFDVRAGERIAVLGANGGGKTTLFAVLLGELAPREGTVSRVAAIAAVPQTDRSRLDFPVSALDVALMGTLPGLAWWRRPGRAQRAVARDALAAVGLAAHAGITFGELSGGQRQRVLVARALAQEAPVLLLDEPFRGLDAQSAERLEALLVELADEGRAILVATHDLDQARRHDRVLCLNGEQIAFGAPDAVLDTATLERTYGEAVVELHDGGRAILPTHHH